jgi:hypothetical protein
MSAENPVMAMNPAMSSGEIAARASARVGSLALFVYEPDGQGGYLTVDSECKAPTYSY